MKSGVSTKIRNIILRFILAIEANNGIFSQKLLGKLYIRKNSLFNNYG